MVSPSFDFEKSLLPSSSRYLLGLDEVGRGPWAGPLVVSGFLLDLKSFSPTEFAQISVRDSKKLSALKRQKIKDYFDQNNYSYHTVIVDSVDLDKQGISASLKYSFLKILNHFQGMFDFALVDGNPIKEIFNQNFLGNFVVKGDSNCFSIASASIVAKVTRDRLMDEFDLSYPQYGFKNHKGYGTAAHLQALKLHGPCPIHRFSYKPIKNLSSLSPPPLF